MSLHQVRKACSRFTLQWMFEERFKRTLLSCPYCCGLSRLLRHEAARSVHLCPAGWDASISQGYPQTFQAYKYPSLHVGREWHSESQEPITKSLQLPHIPATAFSQTHLFLV